MPKEVHLAFVGFEVQRITEPLVQWGADRAYLFTGGPSDAAADYWSQIHRVMRDYPGTEVRDRYVDPWNLGALIRAYAAVVAAETAEGNRIRINLSSGTKPAVMAGMLTAMLHGLEGYYAKRFANDPARGVTQSAEGLYEGIQEIVPIPIMKIKGLDPHELKIIEALLPAPNGVSKEALIRSLIVTGALVGDIDPRATATYNRVTRWLEPMKEAGYVTVNGERKASRIQLTHAGRDIAAIFIDPWRQSDKWVGPRIKATHQAGQ